MQTQMQTSHQPHLDGWRGVAIALVLLCHFGRLESMGVGVTVFFVLSGLLMARILFIQRTSLKKFYWRRASRILPGLWVYLAVAYGAGYLLNGQIDLQDAGLTLTFLRTYFTDIPLRSAVANAHMWSLAVEEHAYLLLSLLAAAIPATHPARLRRWLTVTLAIPALAVVLYKVVLEQTVTQFHVRTEVAIFPLLLSASLTIWDRDHCWQWPAARWVSPACFALALLTAALVHSTLGAMVICSVLLAISLQALPQSPTFCTLLAHPLLQWLGLRSYSIYLWQQLFYWGKIPLWGLLPQSNENLAVGAVLSVAAGYLSYRFVEQPARTWLNAYGERRLYPRTA